MSTATINGIGTGTIITTYVSNGLFGLRKKPDKERLVLGVARGGQVPVGFIEKEGGTPLYYNPVSLRVLEDLTSGEDASVRTIPSFDHIQDRNISKIWNFSELWDTNEAGKPCFKEGLRFWVTFDNNAEIQDISLSPLDLEPYSHLNYGFGEKIVSDENKPKFLPLELVVKDNHLFHIMNGHVPSSIYYQIEVINWLKSHL